LAHGRSGLDLATGDRHDADPAGHARTVRSDHARATARAAHAGAAHALTSSSSGAEHLRSAAARDRAADRAGAGAIDPHAAAAASAEAHATRRRTPAHVAALRALPRDDAALLRALARRRVRTSKRSGRELSASRSGDRARTEERTRSPREVPSALRRMA